MFPPLIRFRDPNILVLMLVDNNGLLSFGTKLEDKFSKLLNINDVLIVQLIHYKFHKVGFETKLTAICEEFMALRTGCPLMDVTSERLHVMGKFGRQRIDDSGNGLVHLNAI